MIKVLPQHLVNQIAAGEVIDRPASVIKELMENAIDAGATEIQIKISDAGKSLISVSDNGCGMDRDSLELCILSHATSKLSDENLFDIHTFGFRGEALPSMTSIARVTITSATNDSNEAWKLSAQGKDEIQIVPAARKKGTTVEVRDVFFATPARLKFLKSDASENEACLKVFNNTALAFPEVSLTFQDGNKKPITYHATTDIKKRITDVFGDSFKENTFFVDIKNGAFTLQGFIGVPTFNKATSTHQHFFVNNRFVKDKIFTSALSAAFLGLMPQGRYPIAVLFLSLPHNEVDVNAHPAKTEIRFKETERVRRFLIVELKKALQSHGGSQATTTIVDQFCDDIKKSEPAIAISTPNFSQPRTESFSQRKDIFSAVPSSSKNFSAPIYQPLNIPKQFNASSKGSFKIEKTPSNETNVEIDLIQSDEAQSNTKFGRALCQISNTYIIAVAGDNLIVVDQHAAAERITLEKLKKESKLEPQNLLLPEMCPFSQAQIELIESNKDLINKFGIIYEKMTNDLIMVQALPAVLGACEAKPLMNDIVDELQTFGNIQSLQEKIHLLMSTISCHGSLRAGKKLSLEEMNSLLRSMENTTNIAQCCHGRPSYVIVNPKNLNKFFERS